MKDENSQENSRNRSAEDNVKPDEKEAERSRRDTRQAPPDRRGKQRAVHKIPWILKRGQDERRNVIMRGM